MLWPAVCDVCQSHIGQSDQRLCRGCWDELLGCVGGDYCKRCGRDASVYGQIGRGCGNCEHLDLHYDGIARGGVYDGVLRDMILAFKFHDRMEFDDRLAAMADSALQGSSFAGSIDYIVPVPLHWRRRIERGYNQSLLISRRLKAGQAPPAASATLNTDLVRIRHTKRQWNLSPSKRRTNVKNAFAVRKGHNFSGKHLCLVDDITTSGATLNECAKTLKAAGAKAVFAAVIAVAMQDLG
ncbi:MAG: ComF family protein [Planctomycetes bacterium]|nr:ComF family protein [Planctomycetota bacterium]